MGVIGPNNRGFATFIGSAFEMGLGDIAVPGGFVDRAALVRFQDIDEVFCVHVALSFSKRRRDLIPNSEGLTKSPIIRQRGEHVIIVTGKTKAPGQKGVQILSIIIAPIFKEYKIRTPAVECGSK